MILIKNIVLAFIGIAAGGTVSAGVFAFITMLGVIPRLAARTMTAKYVYFYESCVILGGSLGNLLSLYQFAIPLYHAGIVLVGLFSGIFVGCLSIALAEVLKVIPVFAVRIKLVRGMPIIVLFIACGKLLGSFYQLFINWGQ